MKYLILFFSMALSQMVFAENMISEKSCDIAILQFGHSRGLPVIPDSLLKVLENKGYKPYRGSAWNQLRTPVYLNYQIDKTADRCDVTLQVEKYGSPGEVLTQARVVPVASSECDFDEAAKKLASCVQE